ncbi:unnamed protein product [Diamesa hyperborea]
MAGNFDKLHEEELIMILKLVKNKKALYLTCTRLNELCLQIDNKAKICGLVITSPATLRVHAESIINSNRIVTSLVVRKVKERGLLTSVLQTIGPNIKRFTMKECSLHDLSVCLSLLPNIEKLFLYNIIYESVPVIDSFSLNKLREMEVLCCDYRITQVLRAFPDNVLEKLKILGALSPIELFVMRQRSLKILTITSADNSNYLFNFKDLKLVSFDSDDSGNLIPFLRSQPQLNNLTLSALNIDDATFHCVTQFKCLINLRINVEGVSRYAVRALNQLTNLQSLVIMNMNNEEYQGEITELSEIKHDNLTVLIIKFPYLNVPSSDLINIAANFKNLEILDITLKVVTNEHIRPFITTVKKMIIKYWLDFMEDDFFGDFIHFDINERNHELTELHLRGMKLRFEDLPMVIRNYPNLKFLALRFDGSVRDKHIKQILVGMPHLLSLR